MKTGSGRDAFELAQNAQLKKEIGRLKQAARQSRAWADKVENTKIGPHSAKVTGEADAMGGRAYIGEQSRRMQQRRKNLERRQNAAIEEKSALLKNIEQAAPLKLHQLPYHTDRLALLRDVSVCYGGAPCAAASASVSSRATGSRCAARTAPGRQAFCACCAARTCRTPGTVERSSRLRISYVRQDPSGLRGDLGAYAARYGLDESLFKAILRKLDFARVQFEKDMADFSAGQKKKVLLARSLCKPSHLLVWDEPLNYVDVLSRMQIEDLLLEFQPTIVFVEHDRVFCDHVATKAVML